MTEENKSTIKKNKIIFSKMGKVPFILVFLIGFLVMIYPSISNFYYGMKNSNQINKFENEASQLPDKEVLRRIDLAHAYNRTLDPSKISDPFTKKEKEGIAEYARMLEIREEIGHVEIPKIGEDIMIYAGTSEEVLQKGVGHLEGTSLPVGGKSTHTVLTAHRGLPKMKLFTDIDKLEIGDEFYIHNLQTTLAYKVDSIVTVKPSDFGRVRVIEGKDYATLLTCTPYMINSHRLLVRGHRVPFNPDNIAKAKRSFLKPDYKDLISFSAPITVVLLATLVYFRREAFLARKKYIKLLKKEQENGKKE